MTIVNGSRNTTVGTMASRMGSLPWAPCILIIYPIKPCEHNKRPSVMHPIKPFKRLELMELYTTNVMQVCCTSSGVGICLPESNDMRPWKLGLQRNKALIVERAGCTRENRIYSAAIAPANLSLQHFWSQNGTVNTPLTLNPKEKARFSSQSSLYNLIIYPSSTPLCCVAR